MNPEDRCGLGPKPSHGEFPGQLGVLKRFRAFQCLIWPDLHFPDSDNDTGPYWAATWRGLWGLKGSDGYLPKASTL